MSAPKRFVDFRAVRALVPLESVLRHYGLLDALKRSGDTLSGCCPLHQGHNPTQFRVSLSKNLWNCFGQCQAGGNVVDFIAQMEHDTSYGAARKAIEWFRLDPEKVYVRREGAAPAARPEPKPPQETPVAPEPEGTGPNPPLPFQLEKLQADHPYLSERGLKPATIAEFGLGFCNTGKTVFGRIAIPLHNASGELVGYLGRWPGEPPTPETPKYKLPKGFRKSQELFNLHRALQQPAEQPLYLVEGVFDVLHLWQHGLRKVVALLGSSLSPEQERLLFERTPFAPQLVLLLDADDAGRKGTADMLPRLARWTFVKTVQLPREGMQPEHLSREEVTSLPYLGKERP